MVDEGSIASGAKAAVRLNDHLIAVESLASARESGRWEMLWASSKQRLSHADLRAVCFVSRSAQSRFGRTSAVTISKLGNGWLYLILGFIVFEQLGNKSIRVIVAAGLNAGLLHCLYPYLKRRIGRPRPFRTEPALTSLFGALDEHSFPSGHAMTLSGVVAPIVLAWPAFATSAIVLICLMGWARIASGHHYPSDICAGTVLGLVLAYPVSIWCLAG